MGRGQKVCKLVLNFATAESDFLIPKSLKLDVKSHFEFCETPLCCKDMDKQIRVCDKCFKPTVWCCKCLVPLKFMFLYNDENRSYCIGEIWIFIGSPYISDSFNKNTNLYSWTIFYIGNHKLNIQSHQTTIY